MRAILLKPLDGREIGSEATFSREDFNRLKALGAVKAAPAPRKPAEKAAKAIANKAAPALDNK